MKPQSFPRVSLRKLSHEQIRTVIARIIVHWENSKDMPMLIEYILGDLQKFLRILDKILRAVQASKETKEINNLDELRDRAYRLLVRKIRETEHEFDEALVSAGSLLLPVIKKFQSSITEKSYTEQTTLTNLALSELLEPTLVEAVTTLSLAPHIERVKTYNNQFENLWSKRTIADSQKEDLPPLTETRRNMERIAKLLFKNTEYLYDKKHESVDQTLFDAISNELTKASATVKMRETRAENESETPSA